MGENILESLRSEGVLTDNLQEKLLGLLPDNAKEKLSNIFQRYQDLNTDEKRELLNEMVGKFKQSLHDKMYSDAQVFYSPYIVFIFAVLFIVAVLVFFVYKLLKVLSDRKAKREEKKKSKQQKKKK